ncbi:MAG: hypothetical protein LBJ00_17410 [Planctomycetaceae bacterium]|nr:hypothetical protein [Planctomycetaceae bacterium]
MKRLFKGEANRLTGYGINQKNKNRNKYVRNFDQWCWLGCASTCCCLSEA